jgi:hypothetical protein
MSNGCAHYFFAIITFAIITAWQSIETGTSSAERQQRRCPADDSSWSAAPNITANEPFAMHHLMAANRRFGSILLKKAWH